MLVFKKKFFTNENVCVCIYTDVAISNAYFFPTACRNSSHGMPLNPQSRRSKSENNLQFPKFHGHCLVLFQVILTGVEGQFFKHI